MNIQQALALKLALNELPITTAEPVDSKLKQSLESIGLQRPIIVSMTESSYFIVDGARRLQALSNIDPTAEIECLVIEDSSATNLCDAHVLRIHLNPGRWQQIIFSELLFVCRHLSLAELKQRATTILASLGCLENPETWRQILAWRNIYQPLADLLAEKKLPLSIATELSDLPPNIQKLLFTGLSKKSLSTANCRQVIQLVFELYRRQASEAVLQKILNNCQADELVDELNKLRNPQRHLLEQANVKQWQQYNLPKKIKLQASGKKEGQKQLHIGFESAADLEHSLAQVLDLLNDHDFKGYVGRL